MKPITIVLIVLIFGILVAQNVSATSGIMDGNNWSNIDNILTSTGFPYLKNNSVLGSGITQNPNGTISVSSLVYNGSYVPYTGATQKVVLGDQNLSVGQFNITPVNSTSYPNGTLITAPTGFIGKQNTSFIDTRLWNTAGVYFTEGVTEMPLEYNETNGYMYNVSLSNAFSVTLTRAGSILHTTQTKAGGITNTSTLTQDGAGLKFDWGLYNSTLGRRDNRIAFETGLSPDFGQPTGLNLYGNHITNSPDISMIWSTGVLTGGSLTYNNITGNITIANGTVAIRDSNSEFSDLKTHIFEAKNFTFPLRSVNYIYLDYNGTGHPILTNTTTESSINGRTQVTLYIVQQVSSTSVQFIDARSQNVGMGLKLRNRFIDTDRFGHGSGAMVGIPEGLNVSITAGRFYYGLNQLNTLARNTSAGDVIEVYYRLPNLTYNSYFDNGINNTYYDNNGVLTVMTNNKYRTDWLYMELSSDAVADGEFSMILGQNQWNTVAEAEAEQPPASLPSSVANLGVLVGRVIVQKSAVNVTSVESAFSTQFTPAGATSHNSLADLQGGTAGEYYHLTATQYATLGYNSTYDAFITNANATLNLSNINANNFTVGTIPSARYGNDYRNRSIPFIFNNGTNVIGTGYKASIVSDYAGTIIMGRIRSPVSGNFNVTFSKSDYTNYPTTWTTLCTLVLTTSTKLNDATSCNGQTIAVDDNIQAVVNSADITNTTVQLTIQMS